MGIFLLLKTKTKGFFVQIEIEDDHDEALQDTNSLEFAWVVEFFFFVLKWRVLHTLSFTIRLCSCHSTLKDQYIGDPML
jgi:hypothetical protein